MGAIDPQVALSLEDRRTKVADLYCRGYRINDIASLIPTGLHQIQNDLEHIRSEWRVSRIRDLDAHMEEELAKIDNLERQAWAEWERSQKDAEQTRMRQKTKPGDQPVVSEQEAVKVKTGRLGDPRYLERVAWCIAKRCELLGLDPEKRLHITGSVAAITLQDMIGMIEGKRATVVDDEYVTLAIENLVKKAEQLTALTDAALSEDGSANGQPEEPDLGGEENGAP